MGGGHKHSVHSKVITKIKESSKENRHVRYRDNYYPEAEEKYQKKKNFEKFHLHEKAKI